jgi:glutamine amidotransferase
MIGIVNYGAGNIFSLTSALERLNIIPGVGHAGAAMKKLEDTGLVEVIRAQTKPVLGICVGMQLLTEHSEEGDAKLMNIIPVKTRLFDKAGHIKIPHMGWNNVAPKNNNLFEGVEDQAQFYFVHSYFIEYNPTFDIATAEYGSPFSAGIQKDNFYGVQFHPEKSGAAGELVLKNFSKI